MLGSGYICNEWKVLKAMNESNYVSLFQGRGPLDDYKFLDLPQHYIDCFKLYDPVGGEHLNIFMAGLKTSHQIVAVSHGYAWECQT